MEIAIDSRRLTRWLGWTVVLLVLAHLAGKLCSHLGLRSGLITIFDMDRELSVPTLFSTSALLLSALLFGVAAASGRQRGLPFERHWWGLAGLFVFLAVDEFVGLHERLTPHVHRIVDTSLQYAWIIPYGIALVVLAALYRRFVLALPYKPRYLFLAAAAIYVSGGLLLEIPAGYEAVAHGETTLRFTILATIEELLEMAGVVVLIRALTCYLTTERPGLKIGLS
jgi:hypothetical protein